MTVLIQFIQDLLASSRLIGQ